MDSVFLISILIIFFGTFIASVLKHRRKDRVLKELQGFHVTVRIDDKRIWGKMRLYPNAIELLFSRLYKNRRNQMLASYIMYGNQLGDIDEIFRFHDELTPLNQKCRLKEVARATTPGIMRRMRRHLRNFMMSFRDAIDESVGLLLSRVQKYTRTIDKDSQDRLKKISSSTIGTVGNMAFDPVLENYIAHRVVTEMRREDNSVIEYTGILKEYSAHWMSVLDCHLKQEDRLPLSDASRLMVQRHMDVEILLSKKDADTDVIGMRMMLTNRSPEPLGLWHIEDGHGFEHAIDHLLMPHNSTEIRIDHLPETSIEEIDPEALPITLSLVAPERLTNEDQKLAAFDQAFPPLPELYLVLDKTTVVDVYLPRDKAVIRHAGEFI